MYNFKTKISYDFLSKDSFKVGACWVLSFILIFSFFSYVYFTFTKIELSYKTDSELGLLKNVSYAHQQIEERYVSKLESMREEGAREMSLTSPQNRIFVERRSAVARAEL